MDVVSFFSKTPTISYVLDALLNIVMIVAWGINAVGGVHRVMDSVCKVRRRISVWNVGMTIVWNVESIRMCARGAHNSTS